MRIDYRLFFSVLLVLGACTSEPKPPADIIPEDKMAVILADVHIIDGETFNIQQVPDSLYKYGIHRYINVFQRAHTDTAQFRKSFAWYCKHPETLDAIYDDVLKIVQRKSDSLNNAQSHGDTAKVKQTAPVK